MTDTTFDALAAMRAEIAAMQTQSARDHGEIKAEITAMQTQSARDHGETKAEIAALKNDLKWMKAIGAAILAVLILPQMKDVIQGMF